MSKLPYVYYYTNQKNENIPILTGYGEKFCNIVFLDETEKKMMRHDFPDAIGKLFVHVDGENFKVNL